MKYNLESSRHKDMISRFSSHIKKKASEDVNFWMLLSFLPTFILARLLVYNAPNLFLNIKGVHIHHFTYGIVLLAVSGMAAMNVRSQKWKNITATVFGVGLALAFDEFGMWIRLEDDYWVRQSYDAMVIVFTVLVNIIYFSFFWRSVFERVPIIGKKNIQP